MSWMPGGRVVERGRTNCSNNIVPNCALPTLEKRPFQLAENAEKHRISTLIFLNFFLLGE